MPSESDKIIRIKHSSFFVSDNGYLSDFIIGLKDGQKIKAHKVLLATVSKFFKEKFELNSSLKYFLLPDQFESDIIKYVIFGVYNRYVNILETDLTAFLHAVNYLQIIGFDEIQQHKFKFEKKLSVTIQKLTHDELEKAMGGKCNDKSHQTNNDSRKISRAKGKLKEKIVENPIRGKCESADQRLARRSAKLRNTISENKSATKSEIKMDDGIKLTPKSRRWQLVEKGAKDAFNGLSIDIESIDEDLKPTRKLRSATKAGTIKKISMSKDAKKDNAKTESSIASENKELKQVKNEAEYYINVDSSVEENPKPSESRKNDPKPPKTDKSQEYKAGGRKTKEKRKQTTTLSSNQSIDSDVGNGEQVNQEEEETGNAFDDSLVEQSSKPLTSKSKKNAASERDAFELPQNTLHKKRGAREGAEKTEKSKAKNIKKKKDGTKPSSNRSNDLAIGYIREVKQVMKREENDSSVKKNLNPSTSESIQSEALKKNDLKPPQKLRRAKNGRKDNEQQQEKLLKGASSKMNETFTKSPKSTCTDKSTKLFKLASKMDKVPKTDDPKASRKSRVIKNGDKETKKSMANKEIIPNENKIALSNQILEGVGGLSSGDKVSDDNKCAPKMNDDEIDGDQLFGDISFESSLENSTDLDATSEEDVTLTNISSARAVERKPICVRVVASTPKPDGSRMKTSKRKETPKVKYNVTETPKRKIPKRRRSILVERSRSRFENSSSDSVSSIEAPLKRSKSRLLHLNKTSDSGSGGSVANEYKRCMWEFGSQSSINLME